MKAQRKIGERLLVEALPTSFLLLLFAPSFLLLLFAPSFSLKNPFSADPWRGGQLRLSVHRPLFSGVWAAAVIHGAALALDLDL